MEEKKVPYTDGLIVLSHQTTRKHDKDPKFKVVMKSRNEKITLSLEMPDVGRTIFQMFPMGEVVEISLKEPSQYTLDAFKEESEDD